MAELANALFGSIIGGDWGRLNAVVEDSTCAAVIPCLNDAGTIANLVAGVSRYVPTVIVVDDGSTDGTLAFASAAGAMVVRHPRNLGKGAALRTGLSRARQLGCRWAFTLDGDGQHQPEDIPRLWDGAIATGAELVVGDRMLGATAMPWLRRRVNVWMSRRLSQRTGKELPDTQSGFRLIGLDAWHRLALRTTRFEVESEMLVAFLAEGYRVEFVPIQVVGRTRPSHIRPVADAWRWFRWWHTLEAGGHRSPWWSPRPIFSLLDRGRETHPLGTWQPTVQQQPLSPRGTPGWRGGPENWPR